MKLTASTSINCDEFAASLRRLRSVASFSVFSGVEFLRELISYLWHAHKPNLQNNLFLFVLILSPKRQKPSSNTSAETLRTSSGGQLAAQPSSGHSSARSPSRDHQQPTHCSWRSSRNSKRASCGAAKNSELITHSLCLTLRYLPTS